MVTASATGFLKFLFSFLKILSVKLEILKKQTYFYPLAKGAIPLAVLRIPCNQVSNRTYPVS